MPHVIVKLWPKPEQQKRELADAITQSRHGEPGLWRRGGFGQLRRSSAVRLDRESLQPDILNGPGKLYKQPGYRPS